MCGASCIEGKYLTTKQAKGVIQKYDPKAYEFYIKNGFDFQSVLYAESLLAIYEGYTNEPTHNYY